MKNLIAIILFVFCASAHAQTTTRRSSQALFENFAASEIFGSERGRPFMSNFNAKEFGAAPSNWAIAQNQRGIIYLGNADGVLEYDGVSWRRTLTPNHTVVRSLAVAPDGKVYVGEVGTFGYLAPALQTEEGFMRFVSLLEEVPSAERAFADVWSTCVTSHGIYFSSYNTLFRWFDNRIRTWKTPTRFQFAFVVRDTLYVDQRDVGLMRMEGDSLRLMPGGDHFATKRIMFMLPFREHTILLGTRTHGLFQYDAAGFQPVPTPVDSFLIENQVFRGLLMPDSLLALGTIRGGVIMLDLQNGRTWQRVDKTNGLQDNSVLAMHADRQGSLWLGLYNGIAHVETPAPLSLFGEESGLQGVVTKLIRHQGTLYAATSLGVFALNSNSPHTAAFQPVAGIATQCWAFLSNGNELLAATNDGVYSISKNKLTNLGFMGASALHRSRRDSNLVFVGSSFGLALARFERGRWTNAGKFPEITEEVRSLVETEDGEIWVGTKAQGILRLASPKLETQSAPVDVERFGVNEGLPEGEVNVYAVGARLFFASRRGLFRYDSTQRRFFPDSTFGVTFAEGTTGVEVLSADKQGNVWLVVTSENGDEVNCLLRQSDGSFQRQRTPFLRVPKTPLYAVCIDDSASGGTDGVIWYGGTEGLVRYDRNVPKNYAAPFSTLLRRVIVNSDSTVFAGAEESRDSTHARPTLSDQSKALRFEFSATSFEAGEKNLFQTHLEGFDEGWSPWTSETKKDYTNLSAGEYRFHVRAKNIYQQESRAPAYVFKILPPWYRTWWAYGGYAVMFGLLVFAADRVQRRRVLRKERERAEIRETKLRAQAVEAENKALQAENARKELELQKTTELKSAYGALEVAHENLKATQQQLVTQAKLASLGQLTAGIAHEIKNPLNFVNNFAVLSVDLANELNETLASNEDKKVREIMAEIKDILFALEQNALKINQHGKRADNIVKSMMEHARGSSGQSEAVNLNRLLDETVNLVYYGMRANDPSFGITIEKDYDESIGRLNVVPQDLSRVFLNIINNACYAAHQKARANGHKDEHASSITPHRSDASVSKFEPTLSVATKNLEDTVEIRIRDNGDGIPASVREKVFNPFFTTKPAGQGTGLGLSISYDIIVQKHRGEIKLETEEGKFTEFVVRLPRNL